MSEPEPQFLRTTPTWWAGPFTRVILNEVLLQVPPGLLYHYTTLAGLLGIISQQEIWATHTQYLNDHREFRHGLDIFREELETLIIACAEPERLECLRELRDAIFDEWANINVCVSSFSEGDDSLSQWRAYGGSSGFSIGFPGDHLASLMNPEHSYLAPCIYEDDKQRAVARALLDEAADQNLARARVGTPHLHLPTGGSLRAYLLRFAPLLKHRKFADEHEWRIITKPLMCHLPRFDFRSGGSMITPYYRFPLADEQNTFRVSRVVVSPTPHTGEAHASVKSLLVRFNFRDAEVSSSEVPYRNW